MSTITATQTSAIGARIRTPAQQSSQSSSSSSSLTLNNSPLTVSATRLKFAIDGHWLDLTHWQHQHPGGSAILQHLNGQDATDAFYSLHGDEAIQRLNRMKKTSMSTPVKDGELPSPTPASLAFRQLRKQLIDQGFFKRSLIWEIFYFTQVFALAALGTYCAYYNYNWLSILLVGLSMQQAGWIGHDYVHGRGHYQLWQGRIMSGLINAFSPHWWSNKHNTHHVYTNHVGIDVDIENDPVFHLFFPTPENDVWFRKYQHLYFVPAASFLFLSWRIQSLQHTFNSLNVREIIFQLINYIWLIYLGLPIAMGAILLAGGLVAVIVTVTHQSEEMLADVEFTLDKPYSFVECQFATTRDARTNNFLMSYLWGGMQYQLEHHLFPTIPKYYYSKLAPIIEQWALSNGIEYRYDTVWQIWQRNFNTLKKFAGHKEK